MELLEAILLLVGGAALIGALETYTTLRKQWKETKTLEFKLFRLRFRVRGEKEEKDEEE